MVIVFIGPPGSGKGTQAQVLKDSVLPNLHILTVSSLLKEKSSDGSVLGNEIKHKDTVAQICVHQLKYYLNVL